MGTPFKMKGSPMQRNFGIGSPLHEEKKGEKKLSTWEKVKKGAKNVTKKVVDAATTPLGIGYDKTSQIGMGLKAGLGVMGDASRTENVSYSTRVGIKAGKKAYQKEKKADEDAAKSKKQNKGN